ncbi:hypothetical protein Cgig2_007125 [Carnegiea gigantea]|uniref:Uncharacterized protein n=1 Tax=Carnegiea gigantea TaxID=171969 RepID=A0A9Q1JYF3_9CARY|nr:hypothetical protein Cgig2_007125 [Carnegiea gigantea]
MDLHAAIEGDAGGGRELVIYVLWGNVGTKWRCESDVRGMVKEIYDGKGRNGAGRGVRMIFKGNYEHNYLYVGGNDGPKRRAQKGVIVCKGRMHTCDDDVVCGTSGRKWFLVSERAKYGSEKPQTRLRLERKIIELSDDHEIYVTLDDASNDETIERGCDEGTK